MEEKDDALEYGADGTKEGTAERKECNDTKDMKLEA